MCTIGQKVNDYLTDNIKKNNVPGIAMVTVDNNKKEFYCLGKAKFNKEVERDTIFQIASVSKTFTALGVIKLVEMGLIDLNESINKYLTKFKLPEKESSIDITIEDVLCHTSGIKKMGYYGTSNKKKVVQIDVSLRESILKTGSLYDEQPEKKILYSGINYSLLQLLIEEVTNMSFSDYMQKNILEKLGMYSSTFDWNKLMSSKVARAHGIYGLPIKRRYYSELAAAGLYSTIEDVSEFMVRIINNLSQDDVFRQDSLKYLFKRTSRLNPLAKGVYVATCSQKKVVYSIGLNYGWNAYVAMIPSSSVGIAFLSNSMFSGKLLAEAVSIWYKDKLGELTDINKNMLSLNLEKRRDMIKRFISYKKFN